MCESGGSALRRGSWFLVLRQDLQNSSSVFLLNVVGSIGTCWPRWTRITWCWQPSTSKRTVDSVHGVGRTDTPGMGRCHHNVDELDALEQLRPRVCSKPTHFRRRSGTRAGWRERQASTSRVQRAGPDLSGQRCSKLRLKLLPCSTGEEEGCSSSSSLQRGWSARMGTRWSSHHAACSIRYRSPHVSSSVNDSFLRAPACVALTGSPFARFAGRNHGRQNRKSSFCSGRGENLVTIARFGKPLFAYMHHRVHAVAGALRKPNNACPHPDVSTGWPVMRSTLSSHSADASAQ